MTGVLIVGMPRSGASMVAAALGGAGLGLGPAGDATCHGEHPAVTALHEDLLERLGGCAELPPEPEAGWHLDPGLDDLRRRARGIAEELARSARAWGWRDARGTLTVPFWLDLVPDARVLLCVRDPAEVAASLGERSHLSRRFALELWQRYHARVLRDAPADRLVVTHYATWLAAPRAELSRVTGALGLRPSGPACAKALEAVDPARRRHAFEPDALVTPQPPAGLLGSYVEVCALAGVDAAPLVTMGARTEALHERVAALEAALEQAGARAAAAEREATELRDTLAAARAAEEARQAELREAKAALASRSTAQGTSQLPPAAPEPAPEQRLSDAIESKQRRVRDYQQVKQALKQVVASMVPAGSVVAVASRGDDDLLDLPARTGRHFPAAPDGRYAGYHPADGDAAVAELEAARSRGAEFLLFPSTASWWLEYYGGLATHLEQRHRLMHRDGCCILYDLRNGVPAARQRDDASTAAARNGHPEGNGVASGSHLGAVHLEVRRWAERGEAYEDFDPAIARSGMPRVKAVAFYLPQFHAVPENDEWWGTGFTEWRNVVRGVPRFKGHQQPRIPRDLGFYDLTDGKTLTRQVELARAAGLHGFAFYYYWFNGHRLLERPLDQFVADPTLDLEFCVIWANENWTRRWDGMEDEVLMRQDYDEAADEALVDDLQRYFRDPRYIRVNGRPLFVIYRIDIIPGGREAIERWRGLWRTRHGEDPLILIAQTFGTEDPRPFGADGAVEFPPNNMTSGLPAINDSVEILDPNFEGLVYDYVDLAAESLGRPVPDYPLIKTVLPSWDNDARRQGAGTAIHGSAPSLYERWLREVASRAEQHPLQGERFVFINAWNEWAEGAYLEPDVHHGSAYLNATARAICEAPDDSARRKVLLLGHDAHPHGAQINLRHMAATLRDQFGCTVAFLLKGGGEMVSDYQALGHTEVAADPSSWTAAIESFRNAGFEHALVNTAVCGGLVPALKRSGFRVVSLVHEMPGVIEEYGLEQALTALARDSDHIVVAAQPVADGVTQTAPEGADRIVIRPQGLYRPVLGSPVAEVEIREQLGISLDHRIVLNVGFGDLRKGIDTFVGVARMALRDHPDLHFVWVGKPHVNVMRWLEMDLDDDLRARLHFVEFTDDVSPYYLAADVYFLTSREDPFPSVALEALSAGLPIVAFSGCGGVQPLVEEHGRVVPRGDLSAALDAVTACANEQDPAAAQARRSVVSQQFRFDEYCFALLQLLDPKLQKVSVVVPNFNYASHLAPRLDSVFRQSYPVFEVIVLDDASTDGSLQELARLKGRTSRRFEVIANTENSGSVFRQWSAACSTARGDYLWIAEADDRSKPAFLESVVPPVHGAGAAFGFTDSSAVDGDGTVLGPTYKPYYRTAVGRLMDDDFVLDGREFVRRCLLERNVVLNVSAVVWRRECLQQAVASASEELQRFRLAGDWYLYVLAASHGRPVAYVADALNVHRRHGESVTGTLAWRRHVEEIRYVHELIAERMSLDEEERRVMFDYEAAVERQLRAGAGVNGSRR